MIHYVNQAEMDKSQKVVDVLLDHYREHGGWDRLANDRFLYARLVFSADDRENETGLLASQDREGQAGRDRARGERSDRRHRDESDPFGRGNRRGEVRGPRDEHRSSRGPRDEQRPSGRGPGDSGRPRRSGPGTPALLDKNKNRLIGRYESDYLHIPMTLDGILVGWLAVRQPEYSPNDANLSIKNNPSAALYLSLLALVFCVLFIGLPLSRHIVRPLRSLADAANTLTKGEYEIRLDFARKDEIGKLARDFETLAATLASNEKSRSRWVAGISHELRTPLAIITGEIDAMLERVRPLNDDNLRSLKQEIEQLTHLVNDLYELSNAEIGALRYVRTKINMSDVVSNAVQRFEDLFSVKHLKSELDLPNKKCWVNGDVQRLNQLLNNLLANEIKYAEENAVVKLSLLQHSDRLIFAVEDSGPGVSTEHLDKLFDYIYRVDYARNRKTGGSGLGLAICRKIVEAHDGTISASHSKLGGLKITVALPLLRSD